jgi:hypothetical protein
MEIEWCYRNNVDSRLRVHACSRLYAHTRDETGKEGKINASVYQVKAGYLAAAADQQVPPMTIRGGYSLQALRGPSGR